MLSSRIFRKNKIPYITEPVFMIFNTINVYIKGFDGSRYLTLIPVGEER